MDELKRGFPRGRELTTADTSAFGVVLVCGDMLVETEDWLALVLAIDKLETDGVLFVKPLETEEGGVDDLEGGREEGVSKNQTPTRLRIATQAPIELLDAAAVMDCLQFETPTDGSGEGMTGTVRDRGVTQNPLPSLLQKQYVLVTTAETECETGLDTTDGQTGLLTTKANRDTPPRDYIATHDSNDNSGFMNPCFENSPSTDADDHNRHVLTEVSEKLTLHVSETHTRDTSENEVSEDAVTVTFVGTSRHTRATQKGTANRRRQSSFSVAPTPVAIDMCNRVGSAALRDALSDASNSKALTLNVLTSDVFLTLQELDALRLFLDEKENEKSHTGKKTEVSEKLTLHVSETHTRDTSENEVSEDAVTVTFVGTSRHTRATQKGTANRRRQSSFSVAPTPVAIDMCNRVGSAALRDALSDASNSKALTLNVLTSDVFLTLQELDALRLFLDEKENEKSHTGKGKKRAEND